MQCHGLAPARMEPILYVCRQAGVSATCKFTTQWFIKIQQKPGTLGLIRQPILQIHGLMKKNWLSEPIKIIALQKGSPSDRPMCWSMSFFYTYNHLLHRYPLHDHNRTSQMRESSRPDTSKFSSQHHRRESHVLNHSNDTLFVASTVAVHVFQLRHVMATADNVTIHFSKKLHQKGMGTNRTHSVVAQANACSPSNQFHSWGIPFPVFQFCL